LLLLLLFDQTNKYVTV